MYYVLKSILPGSLMAEFVNTEQENAMIGLRLQLHLFLRCKGDKSSEGAPLPVGVSSLSLLGITSWSLLALPR